MVRPWVARSVAFVQPLGFHTPSPLSCFVVFPCPERLFCGFCCSFMVWVWFVLFWLAVVLLFVVSLSFGCVTWRVRFHKHAVVVRDLLFPGGA